MKKSLWVVYFSFFSPSVIGCGDGVDARATPSDFPDEADDYSTGGAAAAGGLASGGSGSGGEVTGDSGGSADNPSGGTNGASGGSGSGTQGSGGSVVLTGCPQGAAPSGDCTEWSNTNSAEVCIYGDAQCYCQTGQQGATWMCDTCPVAPAADEECGVTDMICGDCTCGMKFVQGGQREWRFVCGG